MLELFLNNNALFAVAGVSAVIGLVSGAVGTPVALRQGSQSARAAAHAALPALTLFFLLVSARGQKLPLIACGICAFAVFLRLTREPINAARVQFSICVYIGLGLAMLTLVNHHPLAARAGLDKFLLGEASTIITKDFSFTLGFGLAILFTLLLFWKNFILVAFDYNFAKAAGLRPYRLDIILSALVAACLALSLAVAGALFAAALLILPALAARQWTNKIWLTTIFAMFLGSSCALVGAVLSALFPRVPSGPAITLALVLAASLSLLFGPAHGLFWSALFGTERQ